MAEQRRERWSLPTFLVAFGAVLLILGWISFQFLLPLALALSVAVVLGRLNERLVLALQGRRAVAALVMTVVTFAGVFAPLGVILIIVVRAAVPLIDRAVDAFAAARLEPWLEESLPAAATGVLDPAELRRHVSDGLRALAGALAGFVASLPMRLVDLIVDAFVAALALFAYFARGPQLVESIVEATPMERRHTRALLGTVAAAIRTVFVSSFITALIQLAMGYVGFRIVGVPLALGLAALMAFFSFIFALVPVLGSAVVWVPVGVGLVLDGRPWAGTFVLAWGALVLGSVDNVVKPWVAKDQLQLSPVLVSITLLGGISLFGPAGALLGPLIAALAAALLRIWTTEFLPDAIALPRELGGRARRSRRLLPRRIRRPKRRPPAPPAAPSGA